MLVKDIMTRHPIMIPAATPAPEAQRIMSENGIRHLPVVGDGKRLEGLITRQSLKLDQETLASLNVWEITRYLSNLPVKNVMVKAENVHTIRPEKTTERAARMMIDHKIGCLPVVEDGDIVVGIISEIDLLIAFQQMLALPSEGVRITVRMPNKKGQFAKLVTVLGNHDIGVMGIGTYPTPRHEDFYDAVLKIRNVPLEKVKETFSQIEGWTIVDIRDVV
ncbi:MAG: CBS domain-containing protein [Anaerolineales bacterium]|nr:CBS domain-containing protein [Anaerolineales bacterium]MCA9927126.1 CBS domain-containing protein [Anaerolineales bacterium]